MMRVERNGVQNERYEGDDEKEDNVRDKNLERRE